MFKIASQLGVNMKHHEMACFHAGYRKNGSTKPLVKSTDTSGKHKIITKTTCSNNKCEKVNCADISNPYQVNPCGRTVAQNITTIPPTSSGFNTEIYGNTTTQEPLYLLGREIDPNINYTGQHKQQRMVEENPPVVIDSKNIKVNPQASKFLQEYHNVINK